MDEEKESLRRQIQLLQGLINSHKTIHGNAPAPQPAANPRWPTPTQPPGDLQGTSYRQQNQSGWKKKYSLVNRTSQGVEVCGGLTGDAQKAIDVSQKPARPKLSGNKDVSAFKWQSAATQQSRARPKASANATAPSTSVPRGVRPLHSGVHGATQTQGAHKEEPWGAQPLHSGGHGAAKTQEAHKEVLRGAQPLLSWGHGAAKTQGAHEELRGARHLHSGGHGVAPNQGAYKGVLRGASKAAQNMSWTSANKTTPAQVPAATQTLFKKPLAAIPKTEGNCAPPKPAFSHRTLLVLSSPQKRNETVTAPKATKSRKTKYIWVADSPKTPPAAKKVSPNARKTSSDGKQKPPEVTAVGKGRKNGASPKATALKNRYKWKAENVSSREAPVTSSHSSAVHRGALRSGPPTPQQSKAVMAAAASYRDSTLSAYKVKSKTKIVRRRSTSRSPVDKKSSPLAPLMVKSHYFLRRRSSPRVKSPCTVRRSSPRGLVHLSKHRLRRLPPPGKQQHPAPSREAAASSSLKSPSSSRVIKTRYRIVKRSGTPPLVTSPLSALSSSLNWRTRLLLLNRLRQNQNQQRWRSRGLCFIGGVMYRVSANKLSKTWSPGNGSSATPKTGKLDVSSTSPGSLYPSRSATPSRYIASRAVQRSLAIIRQAQQKKERKEYCMYYNRFGKCNRGQKCPYIHDPEKVAVCTRFLRGTCKKTDGSCPFSHQVSKDKMPVCSYFLKGICRNNDCPYSHVYVSRKAEVCQDFLKGYCPMGAKCKKKHTLLCPDYARDGKCPQGSKCKLQHRQRKRRLDIAEPTSSSAKQRRKTTDRPGTSPATTRAYDNPSASDEELPGSSGLHTCLSFISLNCSSASEGTPVSERVKSAENSGKPLQIKPRL